LAPFVSGPSTHCTVPPAGGAHEPWLGVSETNAVPDGRVSRRVTADAVPGPLFVMLATYDTPWLTVTGSGASVMDRTRFAPVPVPWTVTFAVGPVGATS